LALVCSIGCATVKSQTTSQAKIPSWAKVSKAQIDEAKSLGVPVAFANSAGIRFVLVPAGEFLMGSAEDEPGRYPPEGPQHKVAIRKPFYVASQSASSHYVGFRICCDLLARK